jgi:hypothetical protein
LTPEGAVIKQGALIDQEMVFEGFAQVFDSEDAAALAIANGKIAAGDVVVIRYEDPKGGPGMREKFKKNGAKIRSWHLIKKSWNARAILAVMPARCNRHHGVQDFSLSITEGLLTGKGRK